MASNLLGTKRRSAIAAGALLANCLLLLSGCFLHVHQLNPGNQFTGGGGGGGGCTNTWNQPVFVFSSTDNLATTLGTWPGGATSSNNVWITQPSIPATGILPLTSIDLAAVSGVQTPAISPDGSKVVFVSNMDLASPFVTNAPVALNIWIVNADGSGLQALTLNAAGNGDSSFPSFTPDGTKIIFTSLMDLGTTYGVPSIGPAAGSNVWLLDLVNTTLTPLTSYVGGGVGATTPVLTPDGTQVVFSSDMGFGSAAGNWNLPAAGAKNIWVMSSVDGSGVTNLTSHVAGDDTLTPAVSPDGTTVAYSSTGTYAVPNIWTVPIGGGAEVALTAYVGIAPFACQNPRFSPDSKFVTFSSDMDLTTSSANWTLGSSGARNIWVMSSLDGSGLVPLTQSAVADSIKPFYTPDQTEVVFSSLLDTTTTTANWTLPVGAVQNVWEISSDGSVLNPLSTAVGGTPSGNSIVDELQAAVFQTQSCN